MPPTQCFSSPIKLTHKYCAFHARIILLHLFSYHLFAQFYVLGHLNTLITRSQTIGKPNALIYLGLWKLKSQYKTLYIQVKLSANLYFITIHYPQQEAAWEWRKQNKKMTQQKKKKSFTPYCIILHFDKRRLIAARVTKSNVTVSTTTVYQASRLELHLLTSWCITLVAAATHDR